MGLIDQIKNALRLGPPRYVPSYSYPSYVPPQPIAIVAPMNTGLVPSEQPVAALVSSINHPKGRAQDAGSLVSGR